MKFIKVTLFSIVFTVSSLANIANAGLIIAGAGLSATDFNESNATFSDLNNTNLLVGTNYTFADVGTFNGFSNHPTGQWLYQNGGTNGYIEIATIGGVDLTGLEFNVANGWDTPVTQYIWLQTFSDGAATGYNFDVTSFSGNLLTLIADNGTTFDMVRLMVYDTALNRDVHSETGYSAAAISNVRGKTFEPSTEVPEPSTLAVFALGLMGLAARRFKKKLK